MNKDELKKLAIFQWDVHGVNTRSKNSAVFTIRPINLIKCSDFSVPRVEY